MLAEQADNVLALNNLAFLYSEQKDPRAWNSQKKLRKRRSQLHFGHLREYLIKQGQPKKVCHT